MALYSKIGMGPLQDESLISDSFGSDGTARLTSKTGRLLPSAPKIMAAAESVLGDTLQRIKNDGLIGLFEGSCTARQSPPMVIEVRSRVGVEGDALGYMGIYLREKREVCGRPMWRHFKQPDHCLAFDGSSWNAQPESMLGEPFGLLRLCDKKALTPDSSVKLGDWEVRSPAGHYMLHSSILCYVVSQDSVPREYVRPASRVLGEHYSPGASSVRGPESGTTRGGGSPKLQPGISGGERLQPPSLPPPTAEYVSRAAGMGAPGRDDICEGVGTRTAARDPRDELRRTEVSPSTAPSASSTFFRCLTPLSPTHERVIPAICSLTH